MSIDLHNAKTFTRRRFLKTGVTLASCAATAPWFVQSAATALAQASKGLSSVPGVPDERVLVVMQLGGGNDGLNTVAPVDLEQIFYLRSRGLTADEALRLVVRGFVESTLRRVPEDLREELAPLVEARLQRLEGAA